MNLFAELKLMKFQQ